MKLTILGSLIRNAMKFETHGIYCRQEELNEKKKKKLICIYEL